MTKEKNGEHPTMKPTLLLLIGLPASGKTTYAHTWLERDVYNKRVSREDIRRMLTLKPTSRDIEPTIFAIEQQIAMILLREGHSVVVDDCNLAPATRERWTQIALECGATITVKGFRDVSLADCLHRDALRETPVGASTITRMYEQYIVGSFLSHTYAEQRNQL